jgi:hypothetical protein
MQAAQPFSWVVDRFENGSAILTSTKGQAVVPRALLPEGCKEGDVLTAEFFHLKNEKKRRENIARALLEEILGSE